MKLNFAVENLKTILVVRFSVNTGRAATVSGASPRSGPGSRPPCCPWMILLLQLKWTDRVAVLRSADEYMDDKSRRRCCGGISCSGARWPQRKMINRPAKLTVSGIARCAGRVAQVWWLIHWTTRADIYSSEQQACTTIPCSIKRVVIKQHRELTSCRPTSTLCSFSESQSQPKLIRVK